MISYQAHSLNDVLAQDFTAVFAAGNEGFTGKSGGLTTVTSPATSKNCICAGATNTAYQQTPSTASSQYTVHRMSISQLLNGGSQVVDNYRVSTQQPSQMRSVSPE
jgi:hypothetical protein